ncbi:MAG: hypothetical protein HYV09_19660 [Deltaproteobacteria bacterium]|nr:hypothetical protein [Deltaproteobacteria bacterium]
MANSPIGSALGRALPLLAVLLAACSGKVSDESPDAATDARADARTDTSTGIPADKRLDGTTAEERGRMCDWIAEKFGGYGKTIRCADGSVSMTGPPSREECLRTFPTGCGATVAQFEVCVAAISRLDWCSVIEPPPECDALRDCEGGEEPVPPEPIDAGPGF